LTPSTPLPKCEECEALRQSEARVSHWMIQYVTARREVAALTAKLPRILSECRRWKQAFAVCRVRCERRARERDEARAALEAQRGIHEENCRAWQHTLQHHHDEMCRRRDERDEARHALREMVDAAHISFALPYPLAKEMRKRFEWLGVEACEAGLREE